jgi:hypothetical protein
LAAATTRSAPNLALWPNIICTMLSMRIATPGGITSGTIAGVGFAWLRSRKKYCALTAVLPGLYTQMHVYHSDPPVPDPRPTDGIKMSVPEKEAPTTRATPTKTTPTHQDVTFLARRDMKTSVSRELLARTKPELTTLLQAWVTAQQKSRKSSEESRMRAMTLAVLAFVRGIPR